jgi:hypothetical protein
VTRLAVIGTHADKGVLSGSGASHVVPRGGDPSQAKASQQLRFSG